MKKTEKKIDKKDSKKTPKQVSWWIGFMPRNNLLKACLRSSDIYANSLKTSLIIPILAV
jgi:hypothetical protein